MTRRSTRGMTGAIAGGLLTGASLLGVLFLLNRGTGFAFCTATSGLGWTVPLVAGCAIGLMAVALLRSAPSSDPDPHEVSGALVCPACGSPIIERSRLCPHCGELLGCEIGPSLGDSASG